MAKVEIVTEVSWRIDSSDIWEYQQRDLMGQGSLYDSYSSIMCVPLKRDRSKSKKRNVLSFGLYDDGANLYFPQFKQTFYTDYYPNERGIEMCEYIPVVRSSNINVAMLDPLVL